MKGESPATHAILASAMTEEEAGFLRDLPADPATLAAKYGLDEATVAAKIKHLAQRGLLVPSRKGLRFPTNLATLHDAILSSRPDLVPPEMPGLWMQLYDGEGWAVELGTVLSGLPIRILRTIPLLDSVPAGTTLPPHEDIEAIIRAHADLISIRECCCRVGAKKCDHPTQVCMQFSSRAEYDLSRDSGRKVSADEALVLARQAGRAGLVPTVGNTAKMEDLDFICFCCGCCCLVINPGIRVEAVQKILEPSRWVSGVNDDLCNNCSDCVRTCAVEAVTIDVEKMATIVNRDLCLGCGACVVACPVEGAIAMELVRPADFIPAEGMNPTSIMHV